VAATTRNSHVKRVLLAFLLVLVCTACGGSDNAGADGRTAGAVAPESTAQEADPAVARGCPRGDWQGPWTACAEADWVARVARKAGYRIVAETGSALVAEGQGDSFYIWTTRQALLPPTDQIVDREGWSELGSTGGVTIYGDERLWRWWVANDTVFWIQAGPNESSTVPDVAELDQLVATSLQLEPPS
jgi:hypothetical protein